MFQIVLITSQSGFFVWYCVNTQKTYGECSYSDKLIGFMYAACPLSSYGLYFTLYTIQSHDFYRVYQNMDVHIRSCAWLGCIIIEICEIP